MMTKRKTAAAHVADFPAQAHARYVHLCPGAARPRAG
jgi:hypothetical protein